MKAFLDGKGLCQKCEGWWWLTDNLSNQLPGNIKVLAVMQTNSLEGNFCVTNHPAGLVHWQFSNYKPCKASPYLEIYHLWLQHVIFMVLSSSSAILFIDKTDWLPVQMKWLSKNKEVKIKNKLTGGSCVLTFEMKGMCILVYGLMSLISTWVLMFLRSSATQRHMISLGKKKKKTKCGLKSRSPLTLYVLSNEGVVHYVTVICFQDFLKFSDVIVLVRTGRKNSQCCFNIYIVSLWPKHKLSSW